ncbi:MAG: CHAP domain-containing protein, partial [Dorea sp.]|nr:CHAP domain-containing protein [Dorea sp.]
MEENMTSQGEKLLKKRERWKRWKKTFRFLACIVVFCTTYALILPALTVEKNAYCGYEEHAEHSKEAGCFKEVATLICDLPESAGHTHTDECYAVGNVLACGLEEGPDHIHDETCYIQQKTLICQQEESIGHTHSDACYEIKEELTCKKPVHSHTKDCYKKGDEDSEEKEEIAGDPKADTETRSDWESTLKDVELTGDWDKDLIAVAESQLGYRESTRNYMVVDGQKKGYTRYGAWYGNAYGDWCAMFVSFCLHYAEVDKDMMPREAHCQRWINLLKDDEEQAYHYHRREDYLPKVGDLIFFDWDAYKKEEERTSDHIGIVAELIENLSGEVVKVRTIEGNSSDKVQYVTYEINDSSIMGYGELPENPDKDTPPKEQTFEGKDYTVTVSYRQKAHIPDQAKLKVDEILKDTKEYDALIKKASKALDLGENVSAEDNSSTTVTEQITFARFFDIRFELDGEEIEPEDKVDVTISYKDGLAIENEKQTAVVHFADSGTEVLEAELSQTEENKTEEELVDTFSFTQESFSVTGTIVYGNWLPFGEYMIVTQSGNKYYALAANGSAVEVERHGDVFQAVNKSDADLKWIFDETNNGNPCYFHTEGGKYLQTSGGNVNIGSKGGMTITNYDSSNGTWNMYYTSSGWTTTYYFLTFSNGAFRATSSRNTSSQSSGRVWFAQFNPPAVEPDGGPQPGIDAVYDHHKTIDYLGDGKTNAETSLTGDSLEDLYRLKLDMTGISKPVDLLLVVDASGSMKGIKTGDGYTQGMPEVIKFLNGEADGYRFNYNDQITDFDDDSADGFIKEFFNLNSRNRMAIAAFAGTDSADKDWVGKSQNPEFSYTDDAWVVKDWNDIGTPYTSVPVADGYYPNSANKGLFIEDTDWIMGTDYSAGLMVAEDMFDRLKKLGDGGEERIKVMVFLSDGMPTYSIVPTTYTNYPDYKGIHYMRRGQGQNRWYNNSDYSLAEGVEGVNDCYIDSDVTFDHYTQTHPDVVNYSIAFRMENGADDVLKYMGSTDAERSNGANFKTAQTSHDIMDMILGVFRPKDVSITDQLSEYVTFYEEQPDVRVTMTPKAGGDPIVLWTGCNEGTGTDKNTYIYKYYDSNKSLIMEDREIVKSVTYSNTEEGEKITAQFDSEYTLSPEYTYELAFNVKASDEAYDTYAASGYDKTGDQGTDYPDNETRSEQPGLRSNKTAYTRFINDESTNQYVTAAYNHPVIQVDKCELKLLKVDQYDLPLKGAEFTLTRDGEEAGTYTVNANGEVTIPSAVLTSGSYLLKETKAPEKCIATEEELTFRVERGMIIHEDLPEESDWVWCQTPDKVTETVNGKTAYPKNQLYKYELKVINTTSDSPIIDPGSQPEVDSDYEQHKTIDYLGDGEANGLTTVSGEDLYRLNLDITGRSKPIDLLFVIDTSGSMKGSEPAANEGITNGMPEVIKFLNGVGNGTYGYDESVATFDNKNCDGFIKEFFEANNENRLAIAA